MEQEPPDFTPEAAIDEPASNRKSRFRSSHQTFHGDREHSEHSLHVPPQSAIGEGDRQFGGGGVKGAGLVNYPSTGFQPVPLPIGTLGRTPHLHRINIRHRAPQPLQAPP
jgi:hypothetical protein